MDETVDPTPPSRAAVNGPPRALIRLARSIRRTRGERGWNRPVARLPSYTTMAHPLSHSQRLKSRAAASGRAGAGGRGQACTRAGAPAPALAPTRARAILSGTTTPTKKTKPT